MYLKTYNTAASYNSWWVIAESLQVYIGKTGSMRDPDLPNWVLTELKAEMNRIIFLLLSDVT